MRTDTRRPALYAVYTAQGEAPPACTDATLTVQATLVRAAHITEIRTAILVVAGVCAPETCGNNGPIDEAIEYYHLDAVGSVRVVTDEVGAVVRRHDYFPFGEGVSAIDGYVQRYAAGGRSLPRARGARRCVAGRSAQ